MDGNAVDQILDEAPCGFLSFTDDSRIVFANATLCTRLGYSPDVLDQQPVEKILAVGSRIFYQTHFFPLVKLHGRAQEIFIILRGNEGEDVGMLCNAVRHQRNGTSVTDCVFMEVRERQKFEDALLQARQLAERTSAALEVRTKEAEHAQSLLREQRVVADEANHAKSNFLAVMSHELRTPLNAIGGYVQLLEMGVHGPISEPQREALGRIDRSQRHLLRLINDVLNLSRIEAGRVDYVVEPVSLSEVVLSVTPMIEPQIASKSLTLETEVDPKIRARADREKLQQILLNLLTNAIKFTAKGGKVRVESGESVGDRTFVSVSDTGVGIPEEMIERIFEPFVQVDASKSRSAEGTGLGLAISRDLARGMGGDLSARSTPGVGSVFRLDLPRH
jgi:signal transduction histidine kinase